MQSITQKPKQHQDIIKNYERNIINFHKERRRILNALNQKYKEKKYLTQSQDNPLKSKTSQTQLQDHPRKLVKLSSQNQPQNTSLGQKQTKTLKKIEENDQNKKLEKKIQIPQAIADRNRRMFGGLTIHLKKAGEHLKSQQFKEKQRSAKEILNKLITKEKQQRQQVQNKQREELQAHINKLQQEKKQVEKKLIQNENQMLSEIVRVHLNTIGQFNMTKSEPKIFWKPSKPLQMAEKQEKIKVSTQKYLKKLQEEWVSKISDYSEVIDHSNYMTQNQRQFYRNFIDKMYEGFKGFMLTTSEPQIFWKPKVSSNKMSSLVLQTKAMLQQKSQELKKVNEDFYHSKKSNPEEQVVKEIFDQQNEDLQGNFQFLSEELSIKPFDE